MHKKTQPTTPQPNPLTHENMDAPPEPDALLPSQPHGRRLGSWAWQLLWHLSMYSLSLFFLIFLLATPLASLDVCSLISFF